MKLTDILSLSFRSIRSNRLRSGITIAIIALGITALIGIVTAIQAMNQKLTESFSTMGANGFTIRFKERGFRIGNKRDMKVEKKGREQEKRSNLNNPISIQEAERFTAMYQYPAKVSLLCFGGNNNNIATRTRKTNPTVTLLGSDDNYVELNGFDIGWGRNFTPSEVRDGSNVCMLGYDVASKLFGEDAEAAINKEVRINNVFYRVIAVLKSRGSTFGFSRDNICIINYKSLLRYFPSFSFTIGVKASEISRVEEAMGEAEGVFRNIRGLAVTEASNFVLERSNSIAEKAIKSLGYLTIAVTLIGLITLIGAAIGLMNIMLVAVAERTKEVGLIKAIGGKRSSIHSQFLLEALTISVIGAFIGIAVGIALGNLFGLLLETQFIIPWNWIIYGIVICMTVGLLAGIYPAIKAGKLSPIEALRYE